jgi:hypothetical protein
MTQQDNSAITNPLQNAYDAYARGSRHHQQQLASNAAAQPYYAGSIYSQQYAQQAALKGPPPHAMRKNQHRWMINGRTMTWQEFLDEMAPGDDNPQRTFLMLKYGGWNE